MILKRFVPSIHERLRSRADTRVNEYRMAGGLGAKYASLSRRWLAEFRLASRVWMLQHHTRDESHKLESRSDPWAVLRMKSQCVALSRESSRTVDSSLTAGQFLSRLAMAVWKSKSNRMFMRFHQASDGQVSQWVFAQSPAGGRGGKKDGWQRS